ncbi:MAG: helix-turn-helix domain-containing protein [Acetobacterium sp.]|jgi:DNA-binding transcriptional regulator PaaX|nr:hypothetical protein [Bacillota bacterium]MCG2731094.1 helix-turn-helix domain-containing protein [Acetobacterium sp.]PKM61405.1 MAG: hypothetical protein CVU99_03395 [Firmicutes bacterium HGW-Firmicutes-4]
MENEIIQSNEPKSVTVKEAAELLGKSEQFVRVALQRGILPIGVALKTDESNRRYNYHISRKKLNEYI